MGPITRKPMLPAADVDEELEARLRGEIPRKRVNQTMHFEQLQMSSTTKTLIGLAVFLGLSIFGWMARTVESTSTKVDEIRAGQVEQVKQQAERDVAILTRLGGVESEVQGLKSRTEKLEQEIRK